MSKPAAKEKVVTLKGAEATELVLSYMLSQNRPYGATDISTNLHGKVTKLQAQKIMAALAEEGDLVVKAYGKTLIYCAKQKDGAADNPNGKGTSGGEGDGGGGKDVLKEEVEVLKGKETQLKAELAQIQLARTTLIQSGPPTDAIPALIEKIRLANETLTSTLSTFSNPSIAATSTPTVETRELKLQYQQTLAIARGRQKVWKEIFGLLSENLGKDWAEVVGIEVEEDRAEREKEVWKKVREEEEREVRKKKEASGGGGGTKGGKLGVQKV